ncbi:AcrR family transcriptional regulator [Nocardioides daedukensis]|uniref:AcrR family transcriptional regulator n=1 Tax=Nocardioides daedukensis TaxID=634462 RepID=A0A7Y9UQC0_9ACTN|nr:AcrR family transcriptional regulator [Nocardioides daedukensis]
MSSQVSSLPARRALNTRQQGTFEKLLVAGRVELDEVGHEALTIRHVAQRAHVSPATAYTYLASKSHLFVELYWRALQESADHVAVGTTAEERLRSTLGTLIELVRESPSVAAAVTPALLGPEPEVEGPRRRIGAEFVRRFESALAGPDGDVVDPRVLDTILLAFSGALLQSGMGLVDADRLDGLLDGVIAVIMKGNQ